MAVRVSPITIIFAVAISIVLRILLDDWSAMIIMTAPVIYFDDRVE